MNARQEDGQPLRVHLQQASDNVIPDLDAAHRLETAPKLPPVTADLWARFYDLHSRRQFSENGPLAFAWTDVEAWQRIRGYVLSAWELDTVFILENVFFQVYMETKPK